MNAIWLVITALAAFVVAYRLYGAFLATKVAVLNDARVTPSHYTASRFSSRRSTASSASWSNVF